MNKVICDVCGTSYPETADQCPICGCASGENIGADEFDEETAPRTYTKGGHFSKSNVKKRNKAASAAAAPAKKDPRPEPEDGDSNKGLLIAVFALMLAIIAVIIFIVIRFDIFHLWGDDTGKNNNNDSTGQTTSQPVEKDIPCTDLTLETTLVELAAKGETQKIAVTPAPADTTEVVEYASSDASIVSVASDGTVTAEGPGQAVITVTCGNVQVKCRVVCNFDVEDVTIPGITDDPGETTEPSETTDPSETTQPSQTTEPPEDDTFKLNRSDISMNIGESWNLYTGSIPKNKITWTSDDESVAKIENGKVTAVSAGKTKVHGEYNGIKSTCIIRVREDKTTEPTEPSETTEPVEDTSTTYEIWTNGSRSKWGDECTLKVGEKVVLTLVGNEGNAVSVTWTCSDPTVCTVEGNTIKRVKAGTVEITCMYKGVLYTYTIR